MKSLQIHQNNSKLMSSKNYFTKKKFNEMSNLIEKCEHQDIYFSFFETCLKKNCQNHRSLSYQNFNKTKTSKIFFANLFNSLTKLFILNYFYNLILMFKFKYFFKTSLVNFSNAIFLFQKKSEKFLSECFCFILTLFNLFSKDYLKSWIFLYNLFQPVLFCFLKYKRILNFVSMCSNYILFSTSHKDITTKEYFLNSIHKRCFTENKVKNFYQIYSKPFKLSLSRRKFFNNDFNFILNYLLIILLFYFGPSIVNASDNCQFPSSWTGLWFQKGVNTIQINEKNITEKGECIDHMSSFYVLENRQDRCFRCLMIFERHANVLQYRESACQSYTRRSKKNFNELCQVSPEEPLYSLFRVNSQPTTCPFTGSFEFTYTANSVECRTPMSMAKSCTDDSSLLFKFQACADVAGSESKVETLECLAQWKEGSISYLVGKMSHDTAKSDQDKFRCFVLEQNSSSQTIIIGQSGDASCEGLTSPMDGIRSLKLSRLNASRASSSLYTNLESQPCTFPAELVFKRLLTTLDSTSIYEFANDNTLNIRNARNRQQLISSYSCLSQNNLKNDHYGSNRQPSKHSTWSGKTYSTLSNHHTGNVKTRMSLGHDNPMNASNTYLEYVIHTTSGCKIGFSCLRIFKRTENVYEFWFGGTEKNPFDVCTYPSQYSSLITLTTLQIEPKKCPFQGVFALSSVLKESFIKSNGLSIKLCAQTQIRVNCNEETKKLELQARCTFQDESVAFNCNGGWKDEQNHYLLLTSEDGTNKYCLIYHSANEHSLNLEHNVHNRHSINYDHLIVTLNSNNCYRHHTSRYHSFDQKNIKTINNYVRNSHGLINFELIKQGSCKNSLKISSAKSLTIDTYKLVVLMIISSALFLLI